jgi:hypothetical protein
MNVEIGTVGAQFLFWEYLFRIFGNGSLQCGQAQTPMILPRVDLISYFKGVLIIDWFMHCHLRKLVNPWWSRG